MKIVMMFPQVARNARKTFISMCALALLSLLPSAGIAQQQIAHPSNRSGILPDAPLPKYADLMQYAQTTGQTGSISGTVLDSTGGVIVGAQVSLTLKDGSRLQTVESDANGEFAFTGIPVGFYVVAVETTGFAPFTTEEFTVAPQQVYALPAISLTVARATTSIVVRPTEEVAAEQVRAEEKQRLLAVFPNFYVSYIPDAAPLTSKQKLSLASHETFDWTSFVAVSAGAGAQQAANAFKGYGQGASGYGKRWGALFADARSSDLLSHYVFASLFHQDPRYFYQGTGTKKSRLFHALSYTFVARSDSGKPMFNYSYLLGDLCSAGLSNAYYPSANRGVNLVLTNVAIGIATRAGQAVLQEFLWKKLTKNIPEPTPETTEPSTPPGVPTKPRGSEPSAQP